MKICIVLGTRPEIIKLTSFIKECEINKANYFIIHTNQHYSNNLDNVFFQDLDLPTPKYNLGVKSGTHGEQTGKMLVEIEKVLLEEKPDVVVVQGDTNTVLAGALAATKLHIRVAHVEAGLRSYDRKMPEEVNRVLVDHISDWLFTPTNDSKNILLKEGIIEDKIYTVGNTIVDAVLENLQLSYKRFNILDKLGFKAKEYFLFTCHRQENVDDKERLSNIINGIDAIYKEFNSPIIYPIHPRTKKLLELNNILIPKSIKIIEPVGFLEFIQLEKNARVILTDSGGVQEEACILHVQCVTLRNSTERPETVDVGANVLSDVNPNELIEKVRHMLSTNHNWDNPFGDGKSGREIYKILNR